ncbi:MAG TPA: cytochrome c3 family protein [Stellaceae bacterium]
MTPIFGPAANLVSKLVLLALGGSLVVLLLVGWIGPSTEWASRVGYPVEQPVPFSHKHHVGGLGLDCRFCHTTVETSATAGMPPTHTCMTCHSQLWTNAQMLAPVRQSLADDKPIQWTRVNRLPDYVYFNHSIHVAKGIGCETCHGNVAQMPLMEKAHTLRMGWCVDCHRDPRPNLRPKSAEFAMGWHPTAETPSGDELFKQEHIHTAQELTDCSVCHR